MRLPDKVYDILKWVCLILTPALITFITTIFTLYNIPNVEIVTGTIAAIATLIGALIGISTVSYKNPKILDAGRGIEEEEENN
jgi:uncharacterized membrane protein YfcA